LIRSPSAAFELFDFRRRVFALYAERNARLHSGEDPGQVLLSFRAGRDSIFREHPQSALDALQRTDFRGLSYYPYDRTATVEADLDSDVEPRRHEIQISEREIVPLVRVALLTFRLNGRDCALSMYWIEVYGGGLFLPFRDTTAPAETYGGGRYLFDTVKGSDFAWVAGAKGRRLVLDFNYAYNPSCAYDSRWVCPLAPPENHLPVLVRAGERVYSPS
jgi:uncharacterized protein (DUF1684 family)